MSEFPRTLYKSGGPNKWGKGKTYSTALVEDEAELKAATKAGYIDSFHDALFGESPKEDIEENKQKRKRRTKAEIEADKKREAENAMSEGKEKA